jgi:hypothetical protein
VTEAGVEVRRPARCASQRDGWASDMVAKVPSMHFEFDSISTLLRDLEYAKKEVVELDSEVRDIGA